MSYRPRFPAAPGETVWAIMGVDRFTCAVHERVLLGARVGWDEYKECEVEDGLWIPAWRVFTDRERAQRTADAINEAQRRNREGDMGER